jgi:hypothetical protein
VCRDGEAHFPLLTWPIRGQSVALFGHTAAGLFPAPALCLAQHRYAFDADADGLCHIERFASQHRPGEVVEGSMVRLHHVVEIFALTDDDCRLVCCVIALESGFMGRPAVHGHLLGYPAVSTDGLDEQPLSRWRIAKLGAEKGDRRAFFVDRTREIVPLIITPSGHVFLSPSPML